jgi:Response regulator containing a CheY-like receiver domain and an HTH DNA-binding domain
MEDVIKIIVVDDESLIRKSIAFEFAHNKQKIITEVENDKDIVKEIKLLNTIGTRKDLFDFMNDPKNEKPDYILLDMQFPSQAEPTGGISVTKEITKNGYCNEHGKPVKVVIITSRFDYPGPDEINRDSKVLEIGKVIIDSLEAGAKAFVSKNASEGFEIENFIRAIACLERGEDYYFNYPVLRTIFENATNYISLRSSYRNTASISLESREKQVIIGLAKGETGIQIAKRIYGKADETQIKAVQNIQKNIADKLNKGDNKAPSIVARAILCGLISEKDVNDPE